MFVATLNAQSDVCGDDRQHILSKAVSDIPSGLVKNTQWKLKAARVSRSSPAQLSRAVVHEHGDKVSNKKLINKSTQMCVWNLSAGYLSANLLRKLSLCLTHTSPSLYFFISAYARMRLGWGEICSVCQPDLAEIDLVYALADCLLMRWGFIIHRLMAVI